MLKPRKLLIAVAPLFFACGAMIERQSGETRDFVEAVVPISLGELSAKIRDGVLGKKRAHRSTVHLSGKTIAFPYRQYRSFSVADWVPHEDTWPPASSLSKDDPAMDRYLRLSPEARRHDLLLQAAGSEWHSEYTAFGKPLPFSCDFIIHLEEQGPGQTRVEVLEYNPRVKFGKRFVIGHGGAIGFVADAVLVPPTTRDRVEMLERIQSLGDVGP